MDFTAHAAGVLREPDAVKWIDADHFVVANEGDYEGGSRSFTIFKRDGSVVFESGSSLERAIAAIGHYPDHRNKKGVELESVEVATFDGVPHLFVASERAWLVEVCAYTSHMYESVTSVMRKQLVVPDRTSFSECCWTGLQWTDPIQS